MNYQPTVIDPEDMEVRRADPSAMLERSRAQNEQLIEYARRYPRSIERFSRAADRLEATESDWSER